MRHTCQHCGKEFEHTSRARKFCSKQCSDKHKSTITGINHPLYTSIKIECAACGKEIERKRGAENRKTCSMPCKGKYMRMQTASRIEQRFGVPIQEFLHDLYITQRLSIRQIMEVIGISNHTVLHLLDDYSIPRRKGSEAVATQWENNESRRKNQSDYIKSEMESGKRDRYRLVNASREPEVRAKNSAMKKGALNPMYGKFGALNGNWTGGKVTYRGAGWNSIKEQAKRRDGYVCQKCGATETLEVHHITPYRLTQDNSLENLITLCRLCHIRIEHGKDTLPLGR